MAKKIDESGGRRKFLTTGLVGGVAAAFAPKLTAAVRPFVEVTRNEKPAEPFGATPTPVSTFEFDELTIGELQDRIIYGKNRARSVTEKYLARIEEIDKHGPGINSVIEVNPDALAIADKIDGIRSLEERRRCARPSYICDPAARNSYPY